MSGPWFDAHNHYQDVRLENWRAEFLAQLPAAGVAGAMTNGTQESDWESVRQISLQNPWIFPSYGLHPWHVATRSSNWLETLRRLVEKNPAAGIGECGLDRWIQGHDLELQLKCFQPQIQLAAEFNRPLSVHCIQAWGALEMILSLEPLPKRGFLIHAYSGPAEMVKGFVQLGASFSFSPYFLHPRKSSQREVFQLIPLDRLLVETDAPDMAPPPGNSFTILPAPNGATLNHPINLIGAYEALATLRQTDLKTLIQQVAQNWRRLFLP